MLVNNVNGELVGASMVKDSLFYIEVAKFVQAYTTIIHNPNEFLSEVGLPIIDEDKDMLNWNQFVKIMQTCDLGFKTVPTVEDLVVYYNYALEIGSIDSTTKRLASVQDVADAQKHYYNFVDEAADRAETEYLKYHKVVETRAREADNIDKKLAGIKSVNVFSFIMMMFSVVLVAFGIVGMLYENIIVDTVGSLIPIWEKKYIGGIIFILVGVILFAIFDRFYAKSKDKYLDLKVAALLIFKRSDETIKYEETLKFKLAKLKKDLKIVQEEIADKNRTYDVKHNIDVLKATNKYYQKLCEIQEEYQELKESSKNFSGDDTKAMVDEEFAPIKLTKEQEENLHTVSRETINLEGQFDEEAYNEKFEKSEKTEKEHEEKQEAEEKQEQKEQDDKELFESIDYIKDILGFGTDENQKEDEVSREK